MSIEIKVPFPKYEGMEVKKVTADIEKGYSVVEYGEKEPEFKNGDIIATNSGCVIIFDYWSQGREGFKHIYAGINECGSLKYADTTFGNLSTWKLATQKQQQILFDALAKEGKKWNAEKLCIEDIEKDILVPESIGIYKMSDKATRIHTNGDGLYISFNDNKQLLCFSKESFGVFPMNSDCYNKVQCKLTPCKREELKEGDTAVIYSSCIVEPDLEIIIRYYKVLPDNKYAKANAESVSVVTIEGKYSFFKVEPIQ